jgi:hypothetical protein
MKPMTAAEAAPARPGAPEAPRTTHALVRRDEELAAILAPEINACQRARPLPTGQRRALEAACGAIPFERSVVGASGAAVARALVAPLRRGGARAWLEADVAGLVDRYRALVGARAAEASLELLTTDACRKYHRDNVGIRLLCTYFGPGTEWAPWAALVHPDLPDDETPRGPDGIFVRREALAQAAAADVLLLKGRRFPGNARNGVVHRSPPIEATGARRLVLRIDEAGAIPAGCEV